MQTETTMPTARTTDTVRARLLAVARGSRFAGSLYETREGRPLAATDGKILVVHGEPSLSHAALALVDARSTGELPPAAQIRVMLDAARHRVADAAPDLWGATVTRDTAPDVGLYDLATAEHSARVAKAREDLAAAEKKLDAALLAKREVGKARDKVAAARAHLRTEERKDHPAYSAIVVGPAALDLRLVRVALRALGAKGGTLTVTGEYDAAVLHTERGVALVMPFRR